MLCVHEKIVPVSPIKYILVEKKKNDLFLIKNYLQSQLSARNIEYSVGESFQDEPLIQDFEADFP